MKDIKKFKERPLVKPSVMRALLKDDNLRGIYAKVSVKHFKKLHVELASRDMELVEWIIEKIEEI